MSTVLITGGTGTIGKRLCAMLRIRGYDVIVLSRRQPLPSPARGLHYAYWNPDSGEINGQAVATADSIINLSGENIAGGRWTPNRKQAILESRTRSCALLVKALAETPNKVHTVVSASAAGYYGADSIPGHAFTEDEAPANDFLGHTCRQWEESIRPVKDLGKRLVTLRTGIVLSSSGGMLAAFRKPLSLGIAPVLGKGRQVISWIHEEDICRMYIYALEQEKLSGAYNAVAPEPATQKKLISLLADINGKPRLRLAAPAFLLKAAMGEMATEVLKSATLSAGKICGAGFTFSFPRLREALEQLNRS